MLKNTTATWIVLTVTAVWVANFVASLLMPDYDGNAINGIFTVIMGAVLAIKGKGDNGKPPGGSVE